MTYTSLIHPVIASEPQPRRRLPRTLIGYIERSPYIRLAAQGVQSLGLRTGLLDYHPPVPEDEYWGPTAEADLEHIGNLEDVCRYSVLVGFISYFGNRPRILDVGCGKGHLRARMNGVDFARYVGIDPSSVAIDAAQTLADERTSFAVGTAEEAELSGFDIVVSNEVFYYFSDPIGFLSRLHDSMSPGGLLLTSMWRHGVDGYLWGLIDERFERLDLVSFRNTASGVAQRGWRVGCHRRR